MEITVTERRRGKRLRLDFVILLTGAKISNIFNIDNIAEARFKFINNDAAESMSISLKKHALAKDSNSIVKLDVKCESPLFSRQWICMEEWMEWQEIGQLVFVYEEKIWLSKISVSMTVIEEKPLTFANMYEDTDLTDFSLVTIDGTVEVHRAFLAAHSDVFKTMLSREWKETAGGCVELKGVTQQTLQHLKQYIYLGTLPDDGLRPLLLIATCYMIDHLKAACISKLTQTVTSDNLLSLLDFACENKIPELAFAMLQLTPANVVHQAYEMNKEKQISKPVDNVVKE